jgi:hypothetical protein
MAGICETPHGCCEQLDVSRSYRMGQGTHWAVWSYLLVVADARVVDYFMEP